MQFRLWGGWALAAAALLFAFFLTDARSPSAGAPESQPASQPSEESPGEESTNAAHPDGMIYIPGGSFIMGREGGEADEAPAHRVRLDPFYIDATEVTNREFAEFVAETGYVTRAERDGYCFGFLEGGTDFVRIDGGSWRHPEGPDSSIDDRMDHPVVCVTWDDATAYARWAGKRLPTEAEWEYAARAGAGGHFAAITDAHAVHAPEASGPAADAEPAVAAAHPSSRSHAAAVSDNHEHHAEAAHDHSARDHADHSAKGIAKLQANVWQGIWPHTNRRADGYFYTSPAGTFSANDWGLHDMIGNVWEWTADWYDAGYYKTTPEENPEGPDSGTYRVARGGSWFCSPQYCGAYNTHYRGASPPEQAFNNVGFRTAKDAPAEATAMAQTEREATL